MEPFEIERFLAYIQPSEDDFMESLRTHAKLHDVPIIKREMKQFMETLICIYKPKQILEIGTAIGYSSLMMTDAMLSYEERANIKIDTIERNDPMFEQATFNIQKSNRSDIIKIHHGEAEQILESLVTMKNEYDLIFMDAAKGQYLTFLPNCMKLLKIQGVLVSDNVLQGGDVARSRFSVPRRQRTIHQRMRQYLWELNHRDDLKTSILNIADGATLSIKLK